MLSAMKGGCAQNNSKVPLSEKPNSKFHHGRCTPAKLVLCEFSIEGGSEEGDIQSPSLQDQIINRHITRI